MFNNIVSKRGLVITTFSIAIVTVLLWKFPFSVRLNLSTVQISSSLPAVKKVLYYGTWFAKSWEESDETFIGRLACPSGIECIFTLNESEYLTSDAIIIHGQATQHELPRNRPPNQKWVYLNRECPKHAKKWDNLNNVIDLTMTYVSKSDIVFNYGKIVDGNFSGGFDTTRNYLEGKAKNAAVVVSNCVEERLAYIHALTKFIDIDVYGQCGSMTLCREPKCLNQLSQYKFYLAFENSVCADYVTEKLYVNALMHGLVPVVIGGGNYSDPSVVPPGSYINAREFSTLKELVDLMSKVGSDPQLYKQYFRWHSEYSVVSKHMDIHKPAFCKLCSYLHQERDTKRYKDVLKWYEMAGHCELYPRPS